MHITTAKRVEKTAIMPSETDSAIDVVDGRGGGRFGRIPNGDRSLAWWAEGNEWR